MWASASISAWVSCTSGSISGRTCVASRPIRFGGTATPPLASRAAAASPATVGAAKSARTSTRRPACARRSITLMTSIDGRQLEGVVAASDSLEPQGLRDDAGDQLFALALRRLEGARS